MIHLVSWLWSPVAGLLSLVFLMMSWAGVVAFFFGLVGVARGRCRWWAGPFYLGLGIIASLLFHGILRLSDWIMQPDWFSTTLFWSAIAIGGLNLPKFGAEYIRDLWRATNSQRPTQ